MKKRPSSSDATGQKRSAVGKGVQTRDVHLVVRLTADEKRRVEDAAARVHLRVSDWVRQVVLTALERG